MKNSVDLSRPLKCLPGGGRAPADTIYWYGQDGKKLSTETTIGHIGPKDETWHTVEITGLKSPANAAMAEIEMGADFPDFHDGLYWQIDEITFPEETHI